MAADLEVVEVWLGGVPVARSARSLRVLGTSVVGPFKGGRGARGW